MTFNPNKVDPQLGLYLPHVGGVYTGRLCTGHRKVAAPNELLVRNISVFLKRRSLQQVCTLPPSVQFCSYLCAGFSWGIHVLSFGVICNNVGMCLCAVTCIGDHEGRVRGLVQNPQTHLNLKCARRLLRHKHPPGIVTFA